MNSFEVGFVKHAQECGFSRPEALHLLKQSLEYPPTAQMFRELPGEEEEHSPEELEALTEMLKQKAIASQLHLSDVHKVSL
jgi:hypothetical protein